MTLETDNGAKSVERNTTQQDTIDKFLQFARERPLFVIIPIIVIIISHVITLVIFLICKKIKANRDSSAMNHYNHNTFCSSEDCVRCNKNDETHEKSLALLKNYEESMVKKVKNRLTVENADNSSLSRCIEVEKSGIQRVIEAVMKPIDYSPKKKQNPNVFQMDGLTTKPLWNDNRLKQVEEILEKNYQTILNEFLALPARCQWVENTTPHGTWRVFHLINQGTVYKENCALVPETTRLISALPGLMKHSVFGNVGFSVVDAGTWITPHYGPCNCRIRCHLGLITTPQFHLIVDGIRRRSWRNGCCLFFDDSFLHEVRYLDDHPQEQVEKDAQVSKEKQKPAASLGTVVAKRHQRPREDDFSNKLARAVFMLDFWHPDLTKEEIDALMYIFPSSESSYEEWKAEQMSNDY